MKHISEIFIYQFHVIDIFLTILSLQPSTGQDKTITQKIASEDLPEKRSHKIGEGCSLFPIHTWFYFLYIILSILLAWSGLLVQHRLLISFHTIMNLPRPKVEVEDYTTRIESQ